MMLGIPKQQMMFFQTKDFIVAPMILDKGSASIQLEN